MPTATQRSHPTLPVAKGTWLTDGQVLAEVVGLDDIGRYELENAVTEQTLDNRGRIRTRTLMFVLTAAQIIHWAVVVPEDEDDR